MATTAFKGKAPLLAAVLWLVSLVADSRFRVCLRGSFPCRSLSDSVSLLLGREVEDARGVITTDQKYCS